MLVLRSISQENSALQGTSSRLGYRNPLSMELQQAPSRGGGEPIQLSTTNLYIKGLPSDTTDASLKALCTKYGRILSTKAVLDSLSLQCKGFGFVDFEGEDCAKKALDSLRQMGYQVGYAKKQEQAETNVFFKNLPDKFTKEDLEEFVKDCGQVSSVHVMKQNGRSTGMGFARMANRPDCEKVIKKYNSFKLPGSEEPLLVKFADLPNRQKSQQVRALTGHDLSSVALPTAPTPYLFSGPQPQAPLSLGPPAGYADNSLAAMTMAATPGVSQMPTMPGLGAMITMPSIMTTMPPAQYSPLAAANYGYFSMAPAAAAYPSLQAQYGAAELFQPPPTAAPTASLYMPSAAPSMQQMMPGMQAAMDHTANMAAQVNAQWQ